MPSKAAARSRVISQVTPESRASRAERDLEAVAEAFAAGVGEHLLDRLVLTLAELLEADFTFVGRLAGKPRDAIRMLALCEHGKSRTPRTYQLLGAPCANVIAARDVCTYESSVARLFPYDKMLVQSKAESYVGAPLLDSLGRVLGLLAVVDSRPLVDAARARRLVKLFANRASLEVERMLLDQRAFKSVMASP